VAESIKNEKTIRNNGIIAVIIFLAIILLPVCYAAYKEIKLRQQAKATNSAAPAPTTK
jgi:anaerobic C4-dicarboxylate transporter